jgi:serine protease Do
MLKGTAMRSYGIAWLLVASSIAEAHAGSAEGLAELFERVKSSVVQLRTENESVDGPMRTLGSGVLISKSGEVMTAAHLVQVANKVTVRFATGESVPAHVIASEPLADVSLLRVDRVPEGNGIAQLADSDAVRIGDPAFVVGAPYGIDYTITAGIISGRRRPNAVTTRLSLAEFFQTDAAINPGNSGGPMFDMRGGVIGIVSYLVSKSGGFEGLGFVVTSQTARRMLIEQKAFWSGVQCYLLMGDEARIFNVPQRAGLLVQQIARDSPATQIGLHAGTLRATIGDMPLVAGGDVILSVNGMQIDGQESVDHLRAREAQAKPGEAISLEVLRGGKRVTLRGTMPE